jgi:hypothetical protein
LHERAAPLLVCNVQYFHCAFNSTLTSSFDTAFIPRRSTDPTTPPTRDANDARALDSIVDVFVDDTTTDDASTRDETFPSKQRLLRSPNRHQR